MYPHNTLRAVFEAMDYSHEFMGRLTMNEVRWLGDSFEFEAEGDELDRELGTFDINWVDEDGVRIIFDAGEFPAFCYFNYLISISPCSL